MDVWMVCSWGGGWKDVETTKEMVKKHPHFLMGKMMELEDLQEVERRENIICSLAVCRRSFCVL